MAKNKIDDIERIQTMINNIDFCYEHSKKITGVDFQSDTAIQYALCMALQIICENANHITEETKSLAANIPWKDMLKTRNVISHEYGVVNLSMVFSTIKNDLPTLKEELLKLIVKLKQ